MDPMTSENLPTVEVLSQKPVDSRSHRTRSLFSFAFEPQKLTRKRNFNHSYRQSEGGQIVVEYVLLLAVAVMMAAIITRMMISPDPGSPGFVLKTWNEIVTSIGADHADDIDRN